MSEQSYKIVSLGAVKLVQDLQTLDPEMIAQHKDAIETTWQEKLALNPHLFNGKIFNFSGLREHSHPIEVSGSFVEYKHFLSQKSHPDLNFGIKPIGVSGVILLNELNMQSVVFARRAEHVSEYPGFYELVPSGSIDMDCLDKNSELDFKSKLLAEFEEETCLSRQHIKSIETCAFIFDLQDQVYDVCCKLIVEGTKALFTSGFTHSKEYQSPIFVEIGELKQFTQLNLKSIVPTSLALVKTLSVAMLP